MLSYFIFFFQIVLDVFYFYLGMLVSGERGEYVHLSAVPVELRRRRLILDSFELPHVSARNRTWVL